MRELYEQDQLTLGEVAALAGLSKPTVRNRIAAAGRFELEAIVRGVIPAGSSWTRSYFAVL
jgi:hypothetical protein